MKNGCIVSLSGGLDSTVALAMVFPLHRVHCAVTFAYGQRAEAAEIRSARLIAQSYEVPHEVIELPFFRGSKAGLISQEPALPQFSIDSLDDSMLTQESAKAVWVPNRNSVFMAVLASLAEEKGANRICLGFNAEEGQTFPDNRPEFLKAFNESLKYSTQNQVQAISPTISMTKSEIVSVGKKLGAPLQYVWSCYGAGPKPCGTCESCVRFDRACSAHLENAKSGLATPDVLESLQP